jgi:hypothetical protein
MDYVLPIGSVVSLTGYGRRVMVAGVRQIDADDTGKIWDYCGCNYPEGLVNSHKMILFDQNHIDSIFCLGYRDGDGLLFTQKLLEKGEMPSPNEIYGGDL